MSREEALEVLGLAPNANAQEIREAYHRLGQLIDPQLGGTPYLSMKIDEARDVLLGE
jgi:curved DNA-binding protein CbpA